jgi:hypothetical protein
MHPSCFRHIEIFTAAQGSSVLAQQFTGYYVPDVVETLTEPYAFEGLTVFTILLTSGVEILVT